MASHVRKPVTHDTTGLITDRFAKIATTYTGGYTSVQYAAAVCTNVNGVITLPAEMRAVADGTYSGDDKDDKERLAMSYLNHEMGHDDVELRLREDRRRRKKIRCCRALYEMVPPELKAISMAPGSRIVLTGEWLKTLPRHGHHIALAYGGSSNSASRQLATLVNAAEDPRQEALVGRRWAGAREHLEFGHAYSLEKWCSVVEEMKATGRDSMFLTFAIGMVYELHDGEQPFGPTVQAQIDACSDLIELFKEHGDWKTPHGYYDAVNFALACLGRVYRREVAIPPPIPKCGECGSENLRGTMSRGTVTIICCDCGHREEHEVKPSESSPMPDEAPPMEIDDETDEPSDGDGGDDDESPECDDGDEGAEDADGPGECEDSGSESEHSDESGEDGPEDRSDGPEEGEGGDEVGEEPEAADGASTGEDGGDTENDSDAGDSGGGGSDPSDVLKIGSIVRLKATGGMGIVTEIHDDGTIEVDPIREVE